MQGKSFWKYWNGSKIENKWRLFQIIHEDLGYTSKTLPKSICCGEFEERMRKRPGNFRSTHYGILCSGITQLISPAPQL